MKRYTKQVSCPPFVHICSADDSLQISTNRSTSSARQVSLDSETAPSIDHRFFSSSSQWTGERFFKEGKTELSSEFVEYEREIDLRKKGIERYVSDAYWLELLAVDDHKLIHLSDQLACDVPTLPFQLFQEEAFCGSIS